MIILLGEPLPPDEATHASNLDTETEDLPHLLPSHMLALHQVFQNSAPQAPWRASISNLYLLLLNRKAFPSLATDQGDPWQLIIPLIHIIVSLIFKRLDKNVKATRDAFRDYRTPPPCRKKLSFAELQKILETETYFMIEGKIEIHRLLEDVKVFCKSTESSTVVTDVAYIVQRYEFIASGVEYQQSIFTGITSLEEARASQDLAIESQSLAKASQAQDQRVKRLTEIAFLFVPVSLIASIFGMNIDALGTSPVPWWAVLVAVGVIAILVFLLWYPRWLRSFRQKVRNFFDPEL